MIVNDDYLRCAFRQDERFLRKLHDYVARYQLAERPALVLQAGPANTPFDIDVRTTQYEQLLAGGGGSTRNGAWWNGFGQLNSRVETSFQGIELLSYSQDPKWASELHTDGHLIAGVWDFAELADSQGKQLKVVPHFFSDIFADFVDIIAKVQQTLGTPTSFDVTATLRRATELRFGGNSTFGNSVNLSAPARLDLLQWRIRRGGDRTDLAQVAAKMASDLRGAFGVR